MADPTRSPQQVNRLLDMVVEEVSLVDRAANRRRFLVVKRSTDMEDTESQGPDDGGEDQTETPPADADATETPQAAVDEATVHAAVEALEALTAAVELLDGAEGEDAEAQLAEAGRMVAEVAAKLGGKPPAAEPPAAEPAPSFAPLLDGLREAIGHLTATLEPKPAATPAKPESEPTPTPAPAAQPESALATQLAALATGIEAIQTALRDQQQRLARVEKSFGMPGSIPTGEGTRRREADADVGWPLDLNSAFDRESVDKAVSFHEV